jgi:predicted transcriptional regulator
MRAYRAQTYLAQRLAADLARLAETRHTTMSEVIRQAIVAELDRNRRAA